MILMKTSVSEDVGIYAIRPRLRSNSRFSSALNHSVEPISGSPAPALDVVLIAFNGGGAFDVCF